MDTRASTTLFPAHSSADESNNYANRRKELRVPLDTPYFLTLHVIGGGTYPAMLADISLHGIQLSIPPGCGAPDVPGDSTVSLADFPSPLDMLDGILGRVAWVAVGRCGVTFEKSLPSDLDILAIAASF